MDIAPSDAHLIARSLNEPERFAPVFDRHFKEIHRFLERRLGRDEADSLAGEVFRIAFEQRCRYRTERADCRPWLYGIAANLVRRQRRSHSRFLRAVARLDPVADEADSRLAVVEDRVTAQAAWSRVAEAVGGLRMAEREVLLLVAWEDLSYDQVAEALGIPVGTVRSRLSRARRRLRERLGPIGEEPGEEPQQATRSVGL